MTSSQRLPSSGQQQPPNEITWSLKGFMTFVKSLGDIVVDVMDVVVEPYFKINQAGRAARTTLFLFGFLVWWIAAYYVHPPQMDQIAPWKSFGEPDNLAQQMMFQTLIMIQLMLRTAIAFIQPFFAPDIFRHVLVVWLAGWVAYQWAAIYLDDIFELGDPAISRKYIRSAAFMEKLLPVQIADGDIPAHFKNSSVIKIGGPGKVLVHMENAALFEKINGRRHIVTAKDGSVLLEGFERLRTVKYPSPKPADGYAIFDLREQFIRSETIQARTRDGIEVTINGISAVYSLYRGARQAAAVANLTENGQAIGQGKIEFERQELEKAIQRLMYEQVNRPWTETAKQGILSAIRTWVARHTLDEFLANIAPPEESLVGDLTRPTSGQQPIKPFPSSYISRAEILQHVRGTPEESAKRGYVIHWVGVGAWQPPEGFPQQYKEAFELNIQNRIQGSELELARIQRNSRLEELVRLIQTVPLKTFHDALGEISQSRFGLEYLLANPLTNPPIVPQPRSKIFLEREEAAKIKLKIILAYREKLKLALEWYEKNHAEPPPNPLIKTIAHLNSLTQPIP